jgi:citrate synthase
MTTDATVTMIPGLEGVPIAESSVSLVEGQAGRLTYRGYSIEDLTRGTSFEEVVALLYDGELPSAARTTEVRAEMESARALTEQQIEIARRAGEITHPMFALQAAVATLGPRDNDFEQSLDEVRARGVALVAKVGHLAGAIAQAAAGRPYDGPRPGESHASMVLRMITDCEPPAAHVAAMDSLLILQADHSAGNASTFTTRVATSTRSEPESVVSAAIGALSGPAHGGANERSLRLFREIGEPDAAPPFVERMLEEKARIPGFGHRVYHVKDPRSIVIQRIAEELLTEPEHRKLYDIALRVEQVATERLSERGLWPNVDLFSGCVFNGIGVPIDFYTPLFAASRTLGWVVHLEEQWDSGNRLFRPRQIYVGEQLREFVPIEQR